MSRPPLTVANTAKAHAEAERSHALAKLRAGVSRVPDILRDACLPEGRALRRIPLVRLLSGAEGTSKRHARSTIRSTVRTLNGFLAQVPEIDRLTVMWVIDARAGGRRARAFADALDPKTTPPWPGFPYAVQPVRTGTMTGSKG